MPSQDTIFVTARDIADPAERAAYLTQACGNDADLRQRVEAMLRDATGADEFFGPEATVVTEGPGTVIGRYKLLQKIGEGGMGVVYMAEQREPVTRKVALKIIKLGMDTKQVVARFEAERQALALMDHPNIAKVLDGGATESGRPYFVMELVAGLPITQFCDEANLSTHDRLELFVDVCSAIQHAHQKGIIHRDIKPSNILVTLHGDKPVPKVIDFGVAKATQGRLTEKTLFTQFQQFIGTPAYMSPEQAGLSGLDIDTRSDIYALGVLLYELLTGTPPFDGKELLKAGLDEMRRTIREQEPPRPSNRISTLQGEDLTTTAKHRRTDPPKLIHLVRGDLDWIVMKALEKDRARRYETANGLASDIKRHLSDEPIVARPPSALYRFQKTVRRNKLAFAAASVVIAALVIGLTVSTWMFFKAQAQKKKAETEAAKATAVSDFLQEMLRSADPFDLKGSDYTVRQLLDDYSAGLGKKLEGQPEVEATVRATIGNAYRRQGAPDKAEPHLERALALRRRLYGEQSEEVALSLVDHAWNLFEQERLPEAEAEVRRALAIYRKRGTDALPVINGLCALQGILGKQKRLKEVEAAGEEALALARNSPEREFPKIATMLHALAEVKVLQAKYVDAENLARQAVEMSRRLQGPEHPEMGWSVFTLGQALGGQHKLAEAERAFRETLAIWRKCFSFQDGRVQLAVFQLRAVLEAKGDSPGLEALARECLDIREKQIPDDWRTFNTQSELGVSLLRQRKYAEAEPLLLSGYEGMKQREDKMLAYDRVRLTEALQRLVQLYEETHRPDQAAEWKQKLAEVDGPAK
jgi:eukaryotic-like serine/threonine-protein kinase